MQHSWTNFIYTRCQNINRKSKSARNDDDEEVSRASKKSKISPEKHNYPSLTLHNDDDDVAFERNVSLLQQEVAKAKLQFACVTSLMDRTFSRRRQWILDEIGSVKEICEQYPCLTKSTFVSMHYFYRLCMLYIFLLLGSLYFIYHSVSIAGFI